MVTVNPALTWLGYTHTHTHSLPSLLFTEAYHIAKLEKPRQNMAYRLQVPLGLVQPVTGVNLCSLTSPPLLLSRLLSRGPICLLGDQIAAFFLTTTKKKKKPHPLTVHPNSWQPSGYVTPSWQDQQPWQLPTWPRRLIYPRQGLHNKWQTGQYHCGYSSLMEILASECKGQKRKTQKTWSNKPLKSGFTTTERDWKCPTWTQPSQALSPLHVQHHC